MNDFLAGFFKEILKTAPLEQIKFKGNGEPNQEPIIESTDEIPAEVGKTTTKILFKFNPLEEHTESAPFIFSQSTTKYAEGRQNDEVFYIGWNLAPGGTAYVPGLPAIGMSFEQHYKPENDTDGMSEMHHFWVTPEGKQVRLDSYTMFNKLGAVDYYHSVNPFYLRDPQTGEVYLRAMPGELRLKGENPVLWLGEIIAQAVASGPYRNMVFNSLLTSSVMKAPPGSGKVPAYFDESGTLIQ